MKYGILITQTPISEDKDKSGYPEGSPLIYQEKQYIADKTFNLYEEAEDCLKSKNYDQGTGFFSKEIVIESRKFYLTATILEIIKSKNERMKFLIR